MRLYMAHARPGSRGKGLQRAVSTLGQPGGFLTNLNVKIPIPDKLQLIEKGLRAAGLN